MPLTYFLIFTFWTILSFKQLISFPFLHNIYNCVHKPLLTFKKKRSEEPRFALLIFVIFIKKIPTWTMIYSRLFFQTNTKDFSTLPPLIFHSTWCTITLFQTDEQTPTIKACITFIQMIHKPIQNSAYSLFTLALYLFDAFVYGF